MTIRFDCPVGAAADQSELEYISALHQTDLKQLRSDGSINAADIRVFLRSRYGVLIDEEEVKNVVISGLGGGEAEEEIIDLMEVVCMLLIPTILKAARTETDPDSPLHEELPDGVVLPEKDLIKRVLKMILEDVTGNASPKPLDEALIAKIFEAYGETDLAKDRSLHKEMVRSANPSYKENPKLDLDAFASGLVHDVVEYDLKNEVRTTTSLDDVLLTSAGREIEDGKFMDAERQLTLEDIENKKKKATSILTEWTAQATDSTAGNYRNKYLMVLLSATVIITYFAYWYHRTVFDASEACPEYVYDYHSPWVTNAGSIGCAVGISILSWLWTFFVFSLFGLFFVGFGSLGNGAHTVRSWAPLLGLFVVVLLVVPVFNINGDVRGSGVLATASLLLGVSVMILHLFNFAVLFFLPHSIQKFPRLKKLLRSSRLVDRKNMKRAGQLKINDMVKHALVIHDTDDYRSNILGSHFANGLHNFAEHIDPVKELGGFKWTWSLMIDNSLVDTYGIWLSDRLLSGNIAQYIVCIYILVAGIQFSRYLVDEYSKEGSKSYIHNITKNFFDPHDSQEVVNLFMSNINYFVASYLQSNGENCTESDILTVNEVESLCNLKSEFYACEANSSTQYLCTFAHALSNNATSYEIEHQLALLSGAGFNVTGLEQSAIRALEHAADASVDSLYPSHEYMIKIPLFIGTTVAFLTSIYLALTFLPSTISTILRLRSGHLPTMKLKEFHKYRCAPDQVSVLTGSMFWGCLLGSALVGGFIGLLVFLCLWQATVFFMARLLAIFVGVFAVAIIRISILTVCRCTMYRAFYRERPLSANISLLALEWANFPLSVGFVLVRTIKLILSACMFIGRIDTPFLAPKVGQIGPIELDNYPTIFMKDLLQHEAHRHPYIEMLGICYLMKLRYRESFGSKAGAAWRLLFVYALLPWMHKYRIQVTSDMGFLLQGLLETTRGSVMRNSALMSQPFSIPEDEDGTDDDSLILSPRVPAGKNDLLFMENNDLKMHVEKLLQEQQSLLATIRELQKKSGSSFAGANTESESEVGEAEDQVCQSETEVDENTSDGKKRAEGEKEEK